MSNDSILIIDDSKASLSFLENLFLRAGYTVYKAHDDQEGWELLKSQSVSLIFSDLEMPVMNGVELCRRVKESKSLKETYFILFTTHKKLDDKVEGLTSGADDYIVKTTKKEEILARVKAGIRVRNLQQELKNTQSQMYQQEKNGFHWAACRRSRT